MHTLIVHAHPEPRSFNRALTDAAAAALRDDGHGVEIADLYAEGFDPVERAEHYPQRADPACFAPLGEQKHASTDGALPADVRRQIDRLERTDLLILQFPMWWHGAPAMLKGWFDRVFVNGGLYTGRMRYDAGYFRGKRAVVSLTTGAPARAFGPLARAGDLQAMLYPVQYTLYYMGFDVLAPHAVHGVQGHGYSYQDADAFQRHLRQAATGWAARVRRLGTETPLTFPGWADWDEHGQPVAAGGFNGPPRGAA